MQRKQGIIVVKVWYYIIVGFLKRDEKPSSRGPASKKELARPFYHYIELYEKE